VVRSAHCQTPFPLLPGHQKEQVIHGLVMPAPLVHRWLHVAMAFYLAFGILFNYACCASANPGTPESSEYKRLLDEAWTAGKIKEGYMPSSSDEDEPSRAAWMDRGPYDWGWDYNTDTPKAPRSHFDHVSKKLVLNMDHYCP
jgi:hypothetical protein